MVHKCVYDDSYPHVLMLSLMGVLRLCAVVVFIRIEKIENTENIYFEYSVTSRIEAPSNIRPPEYKPSVK